jgi:NADH-quinone oxidoreductase subunit G
VSITGNRGASMDLPVVVTEGMVDGVVWVPMKSPNSWVAEQLGANAGDTVVVKGASA